MRGAARISDDAAALIRGEDPTGRPDETIRAVYPPAPNTPCRGLLWPPTLTRDPVQRTAADAKNRGNTHLRLRNGIARLPQPFKPLGPGKPNCTQFPELGGTEWMDTDPACLRSWVGAGPRYRAKALSDLPQPLSRRFPARETCANLDPQARPPYRLIAEWPKCRGRDQRFRETKGDRTGAGGELRCKGHRTGVA